MVSVAPEAVQVVVRDQSWTKQNSLPSGSDMTK